MAFRITKPGIYFDVASEDYFADPCPEPSLSNSGIGILLSQSPAHFAARHPRLNGGVDICKTTRAMDRGSVVHRLALGAGKDYEVLDFDSYRSGDSQKAKTAAEAAGRVPILAHVFDEAQEQAKVVRQHLDDVLLGEPFVPEVVIAWQIETRHGLIWCRGMIDAWCPTLKIAVDLKSTVDASPTAATRRMVNGGYDTQNAFYTEGLGHVIGAPGEVRFVTLFGESNPPFESHGVTIDEAWRSSSWDLCEEAAEIFARCLKAKQWPGYPREPQLLSPPDWLISQRMFRGFAREGHDTFTTTDEENTNGDRARQAI